MNLFFRLLAVLCGAFFRRRLALMDESVVSLRVFPNDLDIYGHVNNGRYFTLMDIGRMDLILRSGLGRAASARGWRPLVGGATIRFHRPLFVFQRFEIRTRIAGWDDKWFYIEQRFERRGHRMASAVVKGLFRGRHGNATPPAILEAVGSPALASPPLPEWIRAWSQRDAKGLG